jgi:hypothetical protein
MDEEVGPAPKPLPPPRPKAGLPPELCRVLGRPKAASANTHSKI